MRLTGLSLTNYGNFKSERIDFSTKPGTLNLLLAPNGGGKSVLRGAFCDLLFGIGGQSPMGFRYGYPGMTIKAEAVDTDGQTFSFGRRKGLGNTLIDANGASLDPATIARRLGAVDRTRLERLFALDTERLRAGQADLLASDGEFGAALVSGAGGARDLRAVRRKLEEARDSRAPTRRSATRPFYVALDSYVAARKRKEASLLRPEAWRKMQQALDDARKKQAKQNEIAQTALGDISKLERIRRIRPILAALDAAAGWLADNPGAPVLDATLKKRLDDARSQIVTIEQRLRREGEAAEQLAQQASSVSVDRAALAEADAIAQLVDQAGAARKARTDLPSVMADAELCRTTIADRLRELGSPLPVERAGEAVPLRANAVRARGLIKTSGVRHAAATSAAAEVTRLAGELMQAKDDAAHLDPAADLSALEACVLEIRTEGDPLRRARDLAQRVRQAEAELAAALARVPGWSGTAEALLAIAVLSPDNYQRHADTLHATTTYTGRCEADVATCLAASAEAREALERLGAGGAVPDLAALETARHYREQGWHLVYRKAFLGDPPTPAEEQAFTGGSPLPLAYEKAVGAADAVADQRMQAAEVLGRIEAAKARLRDAEEKADSAQALHRQATGAQNTAAAAWTEACRTLPLGAAPTLKEVRDFLAARDKAIDLHRACAVAEAEQRELADAHVRWTSRLVGLLSMAPVTDLAPLLAQADARLADAEKDARTRAAFQGRLEATEKALALARTAASQAEAGRASWQSEWDAALRDLGRPAGEDPAVTDDILGALDHLAQAHRDHAGLTQRVGGMRRDIAALEHDAAALAERVAPDLNQADVFALISELRSRLQTAQEAAKQHTLLAEQTRDAEKKFTLEQHRLVDRQDELRAILSLIGAATIDEADDRLRLAAERSIHATALTEAQARLADAGDLLPVETLRTDIAVVSPDDIAGLAETARRQQHSAQLAAQEAAAEVASLSRQLAEQQDATGAVDAAADQQAAVATMGRVLEEALLYHLAAAMLDKALTTVERDSEPKMLQRITALFAALTSGAYARVLTEPDDAGVARLTLLQRDHPDERQAVHELSEGTRDQLYLALRLAAIEAHVAAAPPLPFIGDDILQTFDDGRALAALEVLREVSETTQVILLTHHRHVIDLAQRLPAETVHICRVGSALETA